MTVPSFQETLRAPRRADLLAAVRARGEYPVVIVGAGINGVGVFRDLSLQGVECLLIDKGDLCSGTSAAPSRMIHGGLKYLETGEFRLVEESVHERNQLLKNSAHLVKPLEMIIPLRTWTGGEVSSALRFLGIKTGDKNRGWFIVKLGLMFYDLFSRKNQVMPGHAMLPGTTVHALYPDMNPEIKTAASYFDAQVTMPERLAMELALDAMAAQPASVALNYVSLQGVESGRLRLRDEISGETLDVGAKVVINAAGPWIDDANTALGDRGGLIGGTKGSHLMLDMPALYEELDGRMVYFDPGDGRICLVSPLAGKVLLGSTDIPSTNPDQVFCDDSEVDYMLGALNALFPNLGAKREHIVYSYCGIRPLPRSNAATPGDISRDHSIHTSEPGKNRPFPVLSLVGGKWTTFRAFSEQVADEVLRRLARPRRVSTSDVPIGGGRGLKNHASAWQALSIEVAGMLNGDRTRAWAWVNRYGTRALDLARYVTNRGEDLPVPGLPDYTEGEFRFIVESEEVEHLDDLVLRRAPIALGGRLNAPLAATLANLIGDVKGWDAARREREFAALAETLRTRHRIDLRTGQFI
jgi:glycerol-3-phosphate dehydrogenase